MAATEPMRDQLRVLSIAERFFESSILFALLRLRIFERLGDGSRTVQDLGAELAVEPDRLARVLRAGAAVGVLESDEGEHFRAAPEFQRVLGSPTEAGYLGHWLRNLDFFQTALSHLDQAVVTSEPTVALSADLHSGGEQAEEFTMAMHDYAVLRGRELAKFLDTSGCTSVLDVGCGPGTYAFQLGQVNPALELHLLDEPGVLKVAKQVEARYSLPNEVRYLPVDLRHDEVPGSYDLVLISNTLHMLGEAQSRVLLRRLYDAVNTDGSLVVQAQYLKDDRLGNRWPVLLDLIQLCITSEGRNHTVAETRQWMEDAGFRDIEFCPMTLLNTNSYLRGYRR